MEGNPMKLDKNTLNYLKEKGYWKEGKTTYVIEEYEYPHDECCEGVMCWCEKRASKKEKTKNEM